MRQKLHFIPAFLICLFAGQAGAQTTQPAPDGWSQAVHAFAAALVSEDPTVALSAALPDDVTLREFGMTREETRQRLIERRESAQLVAMRVYRWSAQTVATDLAADIRSCDSFPPSLRAPFIPKDETEARKANIVAQQWISSIVDPAPDDLVAVIVLWEPPPSATGLLLTNTPPPAPKQPFFILIKGKQSESGEARIELVCFGDAKQALK